MKKFILSSVFVLMLCFADVQGPSVANAQGPVGEATAVLGPTGATGATGVTGASGVTGDAFPPPNAINIIFINSLAGISTPGVRLTSPGTAPPLLGPTFVLSGTGETGIAAGGLQFPANISGDLIGNFKMTLQCVAPEGVSGTCFVTGGLLTKQDASQGYTVETNTLVSGTLIPGQIASLQNLIALAPGTASLPQNLYVGFEYTVDHPDIVLILSSVTGVSGVSGVTGISGVSGISGISGVSGIGGTGTALVLDVRASGITTGATGL